MNEPALQTVAEAQGRRDAEHLIAVARAFEAGGRRPPSHVLQRLHDLRRFWKDIENLPRACNEIATWKTP